MVWRYGIDSPSSFCGAVERRLEDCGAISDEHVKPLVQLEPSGAGIAVAIEDETGWRAEAVMLGCGLTSPGRILVTPFNRLTTARRSRQVRTGQKRRWPQE
jgi:hypothetical protein